MQLLTPTPPKNPPPNPQPPAPSEGTLETRMHKHTFGPSHREARTCNSVPAVVPVVLLAAGDCIPWHNCPFDPEILASHEASSCCRPCDRWVEERWRAGWARVRVWKCTRTLKLNKCPFCSLYSHLVIALSLLLFTLCFPSPLRLG